MKEEKNFSSNEKIEQRHNVKIEIDMELLEEVVAITEYQQL